MHKAKKYVGTYKINQVFFSHTINSVSNHMGGGKNYNLVGLKGKIKRRGRK